MFFEKDCTYHIYNRSNETLFYSNENYIFFLWKVRKHILPFADILAYCLMPNHFHFLLKVNSEAVQKNQSGSKQHVQVLSQALATLTSSYTQAINIQQKRQEVFLLIKQKRKC